MLPHQKATAQSNLCSCLRRVDVFFREFRTGGLFVHPCCACAFASSSVLVTGLQPGRASSHPCTFRAETRASDKDAVTRDSKTLTFSFTSRSGELPSFLQSPDGIRVRCGHSPPLQSLITFCRCPSSQPEAYEQSMSEHFGIVLEPIKPYRRQNRREIRICQRHFLVLALACIALSCLRPLTLLDLYIGMHKPEF